MAPSPVLAMTHRRIWATSRLELSSPESGSERDNWGRPLRTTLRQPTHQADAGIESASKLVMPRLWRFLSAPAGRLCLSNIRSGHICGAGRRELGGKESARPVRRHARTAHPSPRRDVCGRHCNMSCTTAAGGGGIRRTRQHGRGITVGSNRSAVRHTRFAMETVETSADRECPLSELVG